MDRIQEADVLIVGGGAAGLAVALSATPGRKVTVVSRAPFGRGGSTPLAQGGIAAAMGQDDSPARHARDTVAVGYGLCDDEVVRRVTRGGPRQIRELLRLGAAIDRDALGHIALGREAAHSRRRVVHAAGDSTGAEVVRALISEAKGRPIELAEQTQAMELAISHGRVCGLWTLGSDGEIVLYRAQAVVLATGGAGHLFSQTTNARESLGEGIAMAARVGARLGGMEFLQFHPTALATGDDPMPLLTEALRGEGATIIDERGHRFLHAVHPLAELAPRDVVARALWRHGQAGHQTLLDARALGADLELRFPRVIGLCQRAGLDPRHEPMPVAPAAHYHMGGVAVDPDGRATVNGLWACGEVAHTGLHGANRLASNSLLEALVCGARLGRALAAEHRVTNGGALFDSADRIPARRVNGANGAMHSAPRTGPGPFGPQDTGAALLRLRHIMWRHCGLERNEAGLHQALSELTTMEAELCPGDACLENALITAQLITRAALMRGESRGAHFRTDHPSTKIQWNRTLYVDGLGRDQPMVAGH